MEKAWEVDSRGRVGVLCVGRSARESAQSSSASSTRRIQLTSDDWNTGDLTWCGNDKARLTLEDITDRDALEAGEVRAKGQGGLRVEHLL